MTPADQHATATAEVDTLSIVITRGATVSPDLILRMVTATRERLNRHRPAEQGWCHYDAQPWPCPDIRDDLTVFAREDDETAA